MPRICVLVTRIKNSVLLLLICFCFLLFQSVSMGKITKRQTLLRTKNFGEPLLSSPRRDMTHQQKWLFLIMFHNLMTISHLFNFCNQTGTRTTNWVYQLNNWHFFHPENEFGVHFFASLKFVFLKSFRMKAWKLIRLHSNFQAERNNI